MKIFKEANLSGDWKCPICKTNKQKEVVLIPIHASNEDGISEAKQVHFDCICLSYYEETPTRYGMIAQIL